MGIPPRRTALRAAHSRHSTRSKHTHTTIAAHTQTKAKMNAATLALLPSAAAAAWYQPMSRYSYTPQVRYYTSDPFWPGSSLALRALAPALARLARQSHALLAPADARPAR